MANSERRSQTARAGLALSMVVDHGIIDRSGRRAGRVDDLVLDINRSGDAIEIVLTDLVSGPLPRPTWRALRVLARLFYRVIGIRNPRPAIIPWSKVQAIDALVHLDVERREARLRTVDDALERIAMRIPGAESGP